MKTNALVADQFRSTREAVGEPVATAAQLERALKLVQSNPTMRHHHTPMGLELLALRIPLTKREKKDKQDCTKGIDYMVPSRTRGTRLQLEANPAIVKKLFDRTNPATPVDWLQAVCEATGRIPSSIGRNAKRVARFIASHEEGGRVPKHIQVMAIDLSAIAQGLALIDARS